MTVFKGSRYSDDRVYVITSNTGFKSLSRRQPFQIPESPGDFIYVTKQGDTLWFIAGLQSVYNEPELYWVLAEVNPNISLFEGMFTGLASGTKIRVPPSDLVYELIGGRPSTRIPVR